MNGILGHMKAERKIHFGLQQLANIDISLTVDRNHTGWIQILTEFENWEQTFCTVLVPYYELISFDI